ncbi:phage protein [Paenibacillus sp. 481]|uniref:phage protein n=1 Tax=Paenibacillus sp. 481 TaxID=2835869 RepID=UPI001E2D410B|nr:hypothetical protein [Paenibacillus sp. 481]UHA71939.1 hypothetical protein KIK04_14495 [Paenibacillus sp. 481]
MENLFKRRVDVLVGGYRFSNKDLTISFDIQFDDDSEPNESSVDIYNLSPNTIANIRKGMYVLVNAGYDRDVGTVLQGEITEVSTSKEQVDRITTIYIKDTSDRYKTVVKQSYRKGAKASEIIRDLIRIAQLPIGDLQLPEDKVYTSGYVVNGDPITAIRKLAAACGAGTYISHGKLMIRGKGKPADRNVIVLSPSTGMIESPQPHESGKKQGLKIKCLMNHRLLAGSYVKVESEKKSGFFVVKEGRHSAANNQFHTEVQVEAI